MWGAEVLDVLPTIILTFVHNLAWVVCTRVMMRDSYKL